MIEQLEAWAQMLETGVPRRRIIAGMREVAAELEREDRRDMAPADVQARDINQLFRAPSMDDAMREKLERARLLVVLQLMPTGKVQ